MNKAISKSLFAIYKDGIHKGNVRAASFELAIKKYILTSGYAIENLSDSALLERYRATIAEKEIHY